jgi:large subunit ribosomal protein L25
MIQAVSLAAQRRERAGKGAARATRRSGRVPGVVYGDKQSPMNISLDPKDLMAQLKGPGFFSRVFNLQVDGEAMYALARDLQLDPVSDRPVHIDFMRFSADSELRVGVQVVFRNEARSPGLKRGGVLNIVRYEIEVVCKPDRIPETITVDLTDLDIGDSVHISHVKLPEGVRPAIRDRDFTVATIAAPSQLETAEELAAAAAAAAAAAEAAAAGVVEGAPGAAPGAPAEGAPAAAGKPGVAPGAAGKAEAKPEAKGKAEAKPEAKGKGKG